MRNPRSSGSSFTKRNNSSFRSRGNNRTFSPSKFRRPGQGGVPIDIHSFIAKNDEIARDAKPAEVAKHKFSDFGFVKPLMDNLTTKGYTVPTIVQDQAIGPIMEGRDLIGLANTGTGKTAAFLLPLINKLYLDQNQKVLIITPTRELALQIEAELRDFSWGMRLYFTTCVGGMPIQAQIRELKKKQNFIIGTPGRINDLAKRGYIVFPTFNNIVLDEVDRMLDMGFVKEITYFLSKVSQNRQSLFFSATMPEKIATLTRTFAKDPVTVSVTTGATAANVKQETIKAGQFEKMSKLQEVLELPEMEKVIIFSETKRSVEKLAIELNNRGFKAESIHGDKRQSQRVRALKEFKDERVKILVATDVAARGLDIKDVSHVINYTLPKTYDDYIHRIGRTGRGHSLGKALTFVD